MNFVARAINNFKEKFNYHKQTNAQKNMSTAPATPPKIQTPPTVDGEQWLKNEASSLFKSTKADVDNTIKAVDSVASPTVDSVTSSLKNQIDQLESIAASHAAKKAANIDRITALNKDVAGKIAALTLQNTAHETEVNRAQALIAKLNPVIVASPTSIPTV